MEFRVPVQLRPAGPRSPNSERLDIFWKRNTTLQCKWRWYEPADWDSQPSWRSSRSRATRNPWKRIWCISKSHPTTVRKTLPRGASAPRDGSATAPLPTRTGATWCAVEEATTHTSTPRCGSATANSTGAALSSATRAASGQRCSPANNGAKQSEPPPVRKVEYNKQRQHHFAHLIPLGEKNPSQHHNNHSLPTTTYASKDGAFWLAGCCNCFGSKGNRIKVMLTTTWNFLSVSLSIFFFLNYNLGVVEFS